MKQLYYGNDYYNGGYRILACSEGIPESIIGEMISCAENISETKAGDYGLVIKNRSAIFYCNSIVAPRNEYGEQRRTYFSHQYYIDNNEFDNFISNMPLIIQNIPFLTEYKDFYDTQELDIPHFGENRQFDTGLLGVAKEAAADGYSIIAYSRDINKENVRETVAQTLTALSFDERTKMSFMICGNARDKRLANARLIFCSQSVFGDIQERFYHKCVYFNMDTNEKRYSADIGIKDLPAQNSYIENGGETMYNGIHEERMETAEPQRYARRQNPSKSSLNFAAIAILLSIVTIMLSLSSLLFALSQRSNVRALEKKVTELKDGIGATEKKPEENSKDADIKAILERIDKIDERIDNLDKSEKSDEPSGEGEEQTENGGEETGVQGDNIGSVSKGGKK